MVARLYPCLSGEGLVTPQRTNAASSSVENPDDAEVTVPGLVRPAVARQLPRVAAFVEWRLVGEAAHVVAQDKSRHGLEHRDIDALAAPGAVAMHEACADRADRGQPHNTIDKCIGDIS